MKSLVYLASPYSNDNKNIVTARYEAVLEATARLLNQGKIVFSPIVHSHFLGEHHGLQGDWDFWKQFDETYIERCDELYVLMLDGWRESKGVAAEIELAFAQGKKVTYLHYPSLEPQCFLVNSCCIQQSKRRGKIVIGLNGYAQSGKDTLAAYLVKNHNFKRIAFADRLREALYRLNPAVSIGKNGTHVRLKTIVDGTDWDTAKRFADVRQMLQRIGTEVGREMFGQNFWVEQVRKEVEQYDRVVITDCRFPNEGEFVREIGGYVVRIERNAVKPVNSHCSEKPLDENLIDFRVDNNSTVESLHNIATCLLKRIEAREGVQNV